MKDKLVILEKIGDNKYNKLGETKVKDGVELIKWKEHQIPKPPTNPYCFTTSKINYIFFDVTNKEYVNFQVTELGLSTEFLEELFGRKMVQQLVKAVKKANEPEKTNWDFIKQVVICGACVLVGYLIGIGGINGL